MAGRVKKTAHGRGVTVDEYINALMNPTTRVEWTICNLCGAKVKSVNLPDPTAKVHPKHT